MRDAYSQIKGKKHLATDADNATHGLVRSRATTALPTSSS